MTFTFFGVWFAAVFVYFFIGGVVARAFNARDSFAVCIWPAVVAGAALALVCGALQHLPNPARLGYAAADRWKNRNVPKAPRAVIVEKKR